MRDCTTLSWAHPEHGHLLAVGASSAVFVWEDAAAAGAAADCDGACVCAPFRVAPSHPAHVHLGLGSPASPTPARVRGRASALPACGGQTRPVARVCSI